MNVSMNPEARHDVRQSEPRRLLGIGHFGQDALASDAPQQQVAVGQV